MIYKSLAFEYGSLILLVKMCLTFSVGAALCVEGALSENNLLGDDGKAVDVSFLRGSLCLQMLRSSPQVWEKVGRTRQTWGGDESKEIKRRLVKKDYAFTFAGTEKGGTAKVCDLHHHAIVYHTVGGLEATVHLDVTGMEVGHALHIGFTHQRGRWEVWIRAWSNLLSLLTSNGCQRNCNNNSYKCMWVSLKHLD